MTKKVRIKNLKLSNFRNFDSFICSDFKKINLITGENGSGKTNLLEAISYLSPGKGLKGAELSQVFKQDLHGSSQNWQVKYELESKAGPAKIQIDAVMLKNHNSTKNISFNGSKINSTELLILGNIIWLTPQINNIFYQSKTDRRKFLDRIVFNFFNSHAANIKLYEHYLKERLAHLTNNIGKFDQNWLNLLEEKIANQAFEIYNLRLKACVLMQNAIDNLDDEFPKAIIKCTKFDPELEEQNIDLIKEDEFKQEYCEKLLLNRQKDAYSGRTNYNVNKSDFELWHSKKQKSAQFCSTGEQKSMLISLIFAHADATKEHNGATPIILLDELFVHLDEVRKNYLLSRLKNSNIQSFITATKADTILEHFKDDFSEVCHIEL